MGKHKKLERLAESSGEDETPITSDRNIETQKQQRGREKGCSLSVGDKNLRAEDVAVRATTSSRAGTPVRLKGHQLRCEKKREGQAEETSAIEQDGILGTRSLGKLDDALRILNPSAMNLEAALSLKGRVTQQQVIRENAETGSGDH